METINSYDILIALIKACQENYEEPTIKGPDGYEATLGGAYYLLGQTVRNLWNREGHKLISKKAQELWNSLEVGEPIFDYWYQKRVYYKNVTPVPVKGYIGANGKPAWETELKFNQKGDSFPFRQVFHIEHIVPVSVIIEQLMSLDLTEDKTIIYKKMDSILNKIYVCYITKEEDRALNRISKSKRSDNYLEVISNEYRAAGIEIAE